MRIAAIISVPVLLGGCVHLDAKPMRFTCGDLLTGNIESYQAIKPPSRLQRLLAEVQRDSGYDECPNFGDGRPDCLADWGNHKARDGPAFIDLSPLDFDAAAAPKRR